MVFILGDSKVQLRIDQQMEAILWHGRSSSPGTPAGAGGSDMCFPADHPAWLGLRCVLSIMFFLDECGCVGRVGVAGCWTWNIDNRHENGNKGIY